MLLYASSPHHAFCHNTHRHPATTPYIVTQLKDYHHLIQPSRTNHRWKAKAWYQCCMPPTSAPAARVCAAVLFHRMMRHSTCHSRSMHEHGALRIYFSRAVQQDLIVRLHTTTAFQCGTVRVFRQKSTLEDAIGSHTCSLEANMCVTNVIPLMSPLPLPLSP